MRVPLLTLCAPAGRKAFPQARWFMGPAKPVDIIWTGFAVPMLISERVVQILRDEQFLVVGCDGRHDVLEAARIDDVAVPVRDG